MRESEWKITRNGVLYTDRCISEEGAKREVAIYKREGDTAKFDISQMTEEEINEYR